MINNAHAVAYTRKLVPTMSKDDIIDMAERICTDLDVPMLVIIHIDIIFVYGPERFVERCRRTRIYAVIVPYAYGQKGDLHPYCAEHGIKLVSIIAPTSKDRIAKIVFNDEGFIHVVLSMGIIGM